MRLWPKNSARADSMRPMPTSAPPPDSPTPSATPPVYGWFFAAMPGLVLGSALQLQQSALFQAHIYLVLMLAAPALLLVAMVWRGRFRSQWSLWLVGCATPAPKRHSIAASGRLVVLTPSVWTDVSQPLVDMAPATELEKPSVGTVQPLKS